MHLRLFAMALLAAACQAPASKPTDVPAPDLAQLPVVVHATIGGIT